jgi:magnesium transporter
MRRRIGLRHHPPGTSPGTLALPPERAAGPVSLSLITYGPESLQEHDLSSLAEVSRLRSDSEQAWLRVVGHKAETLGQLASEFGIHPLVVEDIANLGQRPKVEDYEDYLFVIVDVVRVAGDGSREEQQVSLLLFENLLITVQEREGDTFRLVEERVRTERGKMRKMGVDYLAYALIDAAVDHYFPVLEAIGEHIEQIEDRLLERPERAALNELYGVKRELLGLRKATWPLREMVGALTRIDSALVREATRVWLRDVYDHMVQIIDIVETSREITAQLMDLYLSSVSNRMNEVMKVLTVIATIFIPLTFIVGVYGMNFDTSKSPWNMPELGWYWGYPAVMLLMVGIAVAMVVMFRRRGWF